ncbi:D-aspartate oxidase [Onthophagus taurus]|uniref:D-aspartate oxidase n=1 Tax=Onthophagus taurus TaxID=166361 RepID=UPI000C203318|nr:D-aspartate oxidase [Onthophagus taurus]
MKVAIVGAGVVGLTTAVELQKEVKGIDVTIFADKFYKDTTSYVAAGLFRPGTSFAGPTQEITKKWIVDSYNYWDKIRVTPESPKAGITEISGYIFSSEHKHLTRNHYIEDVVPLYRSATEDELNLCPGNWKYGSFFRTILTECTRYLPWITEKYTALGGRIHQKSINSFSELTDFDLIINCSGLGSKLLCKDHKIVPIRGQVLKVNAPWLKTFFYGDFDTYIIPGFETVTLGGCRQYDSYDLNVNKFDSMAIQERCYSLVPSLKKAEIVTEKVGLRPHRDPVRVEKELIEVNGKRIKVVHNYGHGGYGVTTAPGTALYAVKLVKESLSGNSKL